MAWTMETTQDYYILFRDTNVPVPTDIEYRERCERKDLLLADRAAYVWGYVGKLNDVLAKMVKKSLSHIDKRLAIEEKNFRRRQGVIRVIPRKPAALDFLAQVSPNLSFFIHVPLNRSVRIYPESAEENRQILEVLTPHSQETLGFKLNYTPKGYEAAKRHRSFVELMSWDMLMDMWRDFGCSLRKKLLRRTAEIWVIETLERRKIYKSEEKLSSEYIKENFASIVFDDKYISTLTPQQSGILRECLAIANDIRATYDSHENVITNKYKRVRKRKTDVVDCSEHPPQFQASDDQAVPSVIIDSTPYPLEENAADSELVKEEKPKQTRRNTPERIEEIKKLVEVYWKKAINGEWVTQKDVAKQKFPKEPNILSKKDAKPFMKKISEQVKMAKAKHGSIRNFDNRTRAALLTYIHDILKK